MSDWIAIRCKRGWKDCHTCAIQLIQEQQAQIEKLGSDLGHWQGEAARISADLHESRAAREAACREVGLLQTETHRLRESRTVCVEQNTNLKTEVQKLNKVIDILHSRLKDAPLFPDEDLKIRLEDAEKRIAVQTTVINTLSEQRETYRQLAQDLLNGKA